MVTRFGGDVMLKPLSDPFFDCNVSMWNLNLIKDSERRV